MYIFVLIVYISYIYGGTSHVKQAGRQAFLDAWEPLAQHRAYLSAMLSKLMQSSQGCICGLFLCVRVRVCGCATNEVVSMLASAACR